MKSSVGLAVAIAMIALSCWTVTFAQQVSAPPAWKYEQETLKAALRPAKAQLDEIDSVPQSVRQTLQQAQVDGDAFRAAVKAGAAKQAQKRYRAALRKVARVSRWIVERDAAADQEAVDDDQRLDNLTIAPRGKGTHKFDTMEQVYDYLKQVDGQGEAKFREALRSVGEQMRDGRWYRNLGLIE